jgi:DNA-binding GntR family transcriptional regulator
MAVMVPQQGFRVIDISVLDLLHLTEARICIETLVLRQSVISGDANWEGEVLASHHRLRRTPQFDDDGNITEEWSSAHANFHHTILAGCANQRLRGLAESLRESAEVYRHWSKSPGKARHRDIAAEHQEICDLVIERDADSASEALKRHIELTTELLLEGRESKQTGES